MENCKECSRPLPEKEKTTKPIAAPTVDWSTVIDMAQGYIDCKWSGLEVPGEDDIETYMFEAVLCSMYGSDIYDKLNKL